MMQTESDEIIAGRVQTGDVDAFGVLVERYEQRLKRYGMKFLMTPDAIDDRVQDVFIKAFVNIKSFDPRRPFSPWIYRIAHNEFINALRRKTAAPRLFDIDTLLPHPVAPERTDSESQRQEMRQLIDRCLAKLDLKYREPLILYYFEDLDYQEIAEILHIPTSTVGVRLGRAKTKLKQIITTLDPTYIYDTSI